jgi:hypothetical protein
MVDNGSGQLGPLEALVSRLRDKVTALQDEWEALGATLETERFRLARRSGGGLGGAGARGGPLCRGSGGERGQSGWRGDG